MGERSDNQHLRSKVFCSSCGLSESRRHGIVPMGWQEIPDKSGRQIALCPECVRRNLWLIEARLDVDPGAGIDPY